MQLLLLPLLAGLFSPEIGVGVDVRVAVSESGNAGLTIPSRSVRMALDEVDALFAEGGIRWRWNLSPGGAGPAPSAPAVVAVVLSPRPEHPVVTGCSRNRHDHRLGTTELRTRRITIWWEQVARAIGGDWDRDEPRPVDERILATALGRVLAHELGHLFLKLEDHRQTGLMRPSFSYRSLRGRSEGSFHMSREDLEQIRSALLRFPSSVD
jgi:hypothetical protein